MKPIFFHTIQSSDHRYSTLGDYWETPNSIEVRVSEIGNDGMEALVLIHELVELVLLKYRGVPLVKTDKFDIKFEKERERGQHSDDAEPGDDPRCPYRREHRFAENIERLICQELGIHWDDYTKTVNEMP
jgi:hypothetical protein